MKIEKEKYQNLLKITVSVPKAEYLTEKKVKITTEDILKIVSNMEEYEVLSMLKEGNPVKNFLNSSKDTNKSTWVFQISEKPKPKQKRAPRKKQSSGHRPSIRGRMSKIAKDKQGE